MSEIRFSCPHCGIGVSISDRFAGQGGQCPACGRIVAIPPKESLDADRRAGPVRMTRWPRGIWTWEFWRPFAVRVAVIVGVLVVLAAGAKLLISKLRPAPAINPAEQAAIEAALRAEGSKSAARSGDQEQTPAEAPPSIDPEYNAQIRVKTAELADAYRRRGVAYQETGAEDKAQADFAKAAELMQQSRE